MKGEMHRLQNIDFGDI